MEILPEGLNLVWVIFHGREMYKTPEKPEISIKLLLKLPEVIEADLKCFKISPNSTSPSFVSFVIWMLIVSFSIRKFTKSSSPLKTSMTEYFPLSLGYFKRAARIS